MCLPFSSSPFRVILDRPAIQPICSFAFWWCDFCEEWIPTMSDVIDFYTPLFNAVLVLFDFSISIAFPVELVPELLELPEPSYPRQ